MVWFRDGLGTIFFALRSGKIISRKVDTCVVQNKFLQCHEYNFIWYFYFSFVCYQNTLNNTYDIVIKSYRGLCLSPGFS